MRALRRLAVVGVLSGAVVAGTAGAASAHPLGNFTVNHYDGLQLRPNRIDNSAVLDTAEIPTLQERPSVDANSDGSISAAERAAYAAKQCTALAAGERLTVGGRRLSWRTVSSGFTYRPGAAGLKVSRLECHLQVTVRAARETTVALDDGFQGDRVGWHEITATGIGVQLVQSPVPTRSVSNELRHYPNDLLSSPLDVRSVTLHVRAGAGASTFSPTAALPVAGPLARAVNSINVRFNDLVQAKHLTPLVGLLAVLLALLLGASHAALPGHGKTVMAAYIAGRRGTVRDAITVGATVTVTHTAGVLFLGLVLTLVAAVAGDSVLAYLGVASGLLIAVIGAGLLRSAWQDRRRMSAPPPGPPERMELAAATVGATAALTGLVEGRTAPGHGTHDHGAPHDHDAPHDHAGAHDHGHPHDHSPAPHDHGPHGHSHGHSHGTAAHDHGRLSRRGLIGMGVAGGLVPSPSALVVLLGAIGLGRTLFGVGLVIAYGLGMAATLTCAGLLLVHLRGRLDGVASRRFTGIAGRLSAATPILTAALVLVVGLGLAVRGLLPLVG